ncbi:uncharacterized protein [Acropora muricata]|uniref:uncharacterized protein isoform X2 n=1 Tax=Acropora muricata TaxID=159855 RepID=UPI0034E4FC27
MGPAKQDRGNILLFVPNLIGYVRLILLFASWIFFTNPVLFLAFYSASVILDGIDGIVARQLNQTSAFGAWWGYFISALEWLVFVCTHTLGENWKSVKASPPSWVQKVMANGFKTPAGVFAICGLHVLPIWLYGLRTGLWLPFMTHHAQLGVAGVLVTGRALCMSVEVWFIKSHILDLLAEQEWRKTSTPLEQTTESTS